MQAKMQNKDLRDLRRKISEIDRTISNCLKKRLRLIEKIGKLKAKHALPVLDKAFEEKKLEKLKTDYEKAIFKKIFTESRRHER